MMILERLKLAIHLNKNEITVISFWKKKNQYWYTWLMPPQLTSAQIYEGLKTYTKRTIELTPEKSELRRYVETD